MALPKRQLSEHTRGVANVVDRNDTLPRGESRGVGVTVSPAPEFWAKSQNVTEEASEAPTIKNISELRASFWPEDESIDEFLSFVHQQRATDRDLP